MFSALEVSENQIFPSGLCIIIHSLLLKLTIFRTESFVLWPRTAALAVPVIDCQICALGVHVLKNVPLLHVHVFKSV